MTAQQRFKDTIYAHLAGVTKAFAAPKRLELIDLLSQGPRTVGSLATDAGLSTANASQHLRVLRQARLVETEKRQQFVVYRLADDHVADVFVALRGLAESRVAEVERVTQAYLKSRDAMEPLSSEALLRRAEGAAVTVLDVRPESEFRAGHLRGAVSIPIDELKARLSELPAGREVVAYCRGPYCVMAMEAVDLLRANGFAAHRIELGVADFRARGMSVARGSAADST